MKKDRDYWAVSACLQFKDDNGLVDKTKPFSTYYIEASTAKQAIEKLKKDFPCCNVLVHGSPVHNSISIEDYEKGK